MVLLYGRAGRLTAKNGGVRPGQSGRYPSMVRCDHGGAAARQGRSGVGRRAAWRRGQSDRGCAGRRWTLLCTENPHQALWTVTQNVSTALVVYWAALTAPRLQRRHLSQWGCGQLRACSSDICPGMARRPCPDACQSRPLLTRPPLPPTKAVLSAPFPPLSP